MRCKTILTISLFVASVVAYGATVRQSGDFGSADTWADSIVPTSGNIEFAGNYVLTMNQSSKRMGALLTNGNNDIQIYTGGNANGRTLQLAGATLTVDSDIGAKVYLIAAQNSTDVIKYTGYGTANFDAYNNNARIRGNVTFDTKVTSWQSSSHLSVLQIEAGSAVTFNNESQFLGNSGEANKAFTVETGASLTIGSNGSLATCSLILNSATANISGGLSLKGTFKMANSTVTLNDSNKITVSSATSQGVSDFDVTGSDNSIVLNAANDFGSFVFASNASALTIDTNGKASTIGSLSGDGTLYLMDLVNDTIKIENIDGLVSYTEGDVLRTSNIKYGSEGNWQDVVLSSTTGGYFLNAASSVPEPAEWAAIFGAIALGFAIYRRRK